MTINPSVEDNTPSSRVRCFFDVSLGGLQAGRVVFELYSDVAPKTVENFRCLCTGEKGLGQTTGKALFYKNVIFHRVVKDFMVQSGDFSAGNGTGGESIYGGTFEDESFTYKHDKPFLLSMANRGKNTNGSQFFITTQPAPHLDNVHVVFGHVVSGHDLVRQLEQLPVDRNSRPLQDAAISNCGELVKQVKVKKEKKKKRAASAEDGSSSDSSAAERKKKKEKKKKKDKRKPKEESEKEDGPEEQQVELEEGEIHPMVSLTKIDPEEIPEVSNKFLMRGGNGTGDANDSKGSDHDKESPEKRKERRRERDSQRESTSHDRGGRRNTFGWSKRRVPLSRSGRAIKGRGVFRYRTPSRSRSRTRSVTPPHWKQAQKRTIKLSDLEKIEEEKRMREEEIKRRETERKKRHEEMAKDSKKSFYELSHEENYNPKDTKHVEKKTESEHIEKADSPRSRRKSQGSVDLNALDYEDQGNTDTEEKDTNNDNNKSESMAMAFGVDIKAPEKHLIEDNIEKDRRRERNEEKDNNKSLSKSDKKDDIRRRSRDRSQDVRKRSSENRNRSPDNRNRRSRSRDRRDRFVYKRQNVRSPRRRNFNNNRGNRGFSDRRRQRSRSFERSRMRRSPDRRRSRDRRRRSRSRSPARNKKSSRYSRERRSTRSRTPSRRRRSETPDKRANSKELKTKDHKDDRSPPPRETSVEDKEKLAKEKMLKRAEALQMFKDHMRKEIAKEEEKRAEKKRQEELEKEEAARELEELEKLKQETLQKLQEHEKLKQLTAVKKVLEAVVTTAVKESVSHKRTGSTSPEKDEKDRAKKRKRSEKRKKSSKKRSVSPRSASD